MQIYNNNVRYWEYSSSSTSYKIACRPNTTYVISENNPDNSIFRAGYVISDENPTDSKSIDIYNVTAYTNDNIPIVVTTGENAKYIVVQIDTNDAFNSIQTLQVQEGNNKTSYEPYGYKIQEIVYGKNLFNIAKVATGKYVINNGNDLTITGERYATGIGKLKDLCPLLKVGDKVTINFITDGVRAAYINSEYWNPGTSKTITQEFLDSYLNLYPKKIENTNPSSLISNIQVEYGDKVTSYELYKDPVIKNIYLNEPLRSVNKVSDYIDYSKQKIIRNIGNVILDENDSYYMMLDGKANANGFYSFRVKLNKEVTNKTTNIPAMSNLWGYKVQGAESAAEESIFVQRGVGATYLHIRTSKYSTVNELKEMLKENPLNVIWQLESSKEEDILLPPIKTYNGNTNVSASDGAIFSSNIEVDY